MLNCDCDWVRARAAPSPAVRAHMAIQCRGVLVLQVTTLRAIEKKRPDQEGETLCW